MIDRFGSISCQDFIYSAVISLKSMYRFIKDMTEMTVMAKIISAINNLIDSFFIPYHLLYKSFSMIVFDTLTSGEITLLCIENINLKIRE